MGLTDRFAKERAVPLYREAFRAYGLPAGEGDPAMVSARIRNRPAFVRETILSALDDWDFLAGEAINGVHEPHREWLRSVVEAAEPAESWVRQFWAARRETDPARRQAALEALATSADVRKIPPQALSNFAWLLRPALAAALYRRAQQQYPGDFWINSCLPVKCCNPKLTPPERGEAIRFPDGPLSACAAGERVMPSYILAHAACTIRVDWRRPSPVTARPSRSTRSTFTPMATWAPFSAPAAGANRPSFSAARPSKSIRHLSQLTPC